jgi:hypothetical protein
MRKLSSTGGLLSALPLALLSILDAHGAWQAVPNVELRAAHEENPRLQGDLLADDTATSTILNASVDLSTFNQRGFLNFTPRVEAHIYSDQANQDLEGDDYYLNGRGEYRWQVVTLGFRSDYRKRAIQRAEVADIDDPVFDDDGNVIEAPDDFDSGRLTFINQDQEHFTLQPYMNFRLSERSTIRMQVVSTEVSYSGGNTAARTGFDNRSLRTGVIRRVNEQSQVSATLIVSEYEAEANNNVTETVGVEGAIRRRVSELWTVNVNVGVVRTDFIFEDITQQVVDNASADYTIGVRASRRGERTRLDFRADQRLTPNTSGFVTRRDELRAYVNHDITQRLSTRFGVRLTHNEAVGDAAPSNDRDYARYELSFDWALRPRWLLTAGYDYTTQEFTQQQLADARTSSNMFYIGVGYRGLSRPGAPR